MSKPKTHISRRWVLAGLLSGGASVALAEPPLRSLRPTPRPGGKGGRMAPSAEYLVERARLGTATVGFVVADAETGEVLEARKPLLPLPPASVAKALTTLYALDALGPEHRFATRLVATGPVEGGVLKGDLVLMGSGDPTLDTDRLAELAMKLKAAGVTSVEGAFLTWSRALPTLTEIDPEQPVQVGYNPAVSGLNLNFNRVHFEWRRAGAGWNTAMDARSATHRPDVRVARMAIVKRRYPIYTYEDDGTADLWTVASGALGQNGSRWLPVRKPESYTAEVFQSFAKGQGISLGAAKPVDEPPAGTELARVESQDLRALLRDMLKYSTNVTAEAVGLAASVARGPVPATLVESGARMSDWLGGEIGSPRPALVDHSGLGGASRITTRDMVRALVDLGPAVDLEPLLKEIRMKDANGRPMDSYPASIMAKTGTLNFVSTLAGYVTLPGGRKLAFASFMADPERRDAIPVEQRERPEGVASWTARARTLQLRLIDRWVTTYDMTT
ncbi:D-alanyl-D-alanine carboxypeptidase/D-alanyl-D-alanine endopeptidase [Tropicimonas sediminicola]|uniref:D-alanyl-D-alanine carboxypeptidase / D-alanyl-D-alanine-endopeptidase (Penicillin-binding protein 4) n=1 Tax=Tropicimonas sediminicola TaxID=1031541 RepID=A0A239HYB4_9RHOB|nr:D-alanyl-D-alanine carboxypeptidase/D-alanyl-D-alanine-endopeptidase [Tropicimonas sediminicola]SNS85703.1 D-alanyl-D-alanine carboxypeptidase / D-alanyl-D-alanine-endopeptidase (penicillin-binding protein 4) [Tropicimonas sediminicola]